MPIAVPCSFSSLNYVYFQVKERQTFGVVILITLCAI